MENNVPLSQKLYFLGIHPEKGGIISWSYTAMDYVLVGSLFMELYQLKKIKFENKRILVLSTKADSELHEFMLLKMNKAKSPKKISTWIQKFYFSLKYIRKEVQKGLKEKRLVKMEPKRFLFFKWQKPRIVNKQYMHRLLNEIESQIFKGTNVEEELILLSFLEPGGLHYRLFGERKKRREAKKKLKQLMVENRVSHAVADAISAAQAVADSVAVSVAVTTASS